MPKFLISETIHSEKVKTVRGGTTSVKYGYNENGKAVKLSTADNYVLCAAGDRIEAIQLTSNLDTQGTVDGYAIIGIVSTGYKSVTFDGLQATPGTGVVAAGDYVVVGTVVAAGTALGSGVSLKVCKATDQAAAATAAYRARVVSLGNAGTGAVGTTGIIELF
jgi:hypothetical protein